MNTALLVALIAAATALIGTSINFFSSLLGHWYSRNAKIEDLRLAKRLESIEAISSQLSNNTSEVDRLFMKLSEMLHTFRYKLAEELVDEGFIDDGQSLDSARMRRSESSTIVNESKEMLKASKIAINDCDEVTFQLLDWRRYGFGNFTVWLGDRVSIEYSLLELAMMQIQIIGDLVDILETQIELCDKVLSEMYSDYDEDNLVYFIWKSSQASMDSVDDSRKHYVTETLFINNELTKELHNNSVSFVEFMGQTFFTTKKRTDLGKSTESATQEGVFVNMARRIERLLGRRP